ncbi:Secretion protein HylD [Sphingomonas sp. EC-HK361]|uniref:efflux RND transporter periplasmic adaptor subunit n=1 Tax=Sphingomonas sp. EC-HK361 TaxID=2038397 RepID=UPI00125C1AA5|nr:efflux RND transporter periplasmic adaptor subunit [Sphingomonas sp. EC-HK361]VVT15271.1 Secretion protein HylD [Sphingomonas sp. EC-HK361]
MSYESGNLEGEPLAIEGPDAPRSRRRLFVGAGIVVIAILIAVWAFSGGKKDGAKTSGVPVEQVPSVTVVVPGRHTVDRTINATGSLAARVDMPVGVAGEGGLVTRVLVQPGQWVGAGQVLATVDRSVQTQTAASLDASVAVARSDLAIAQSNLDRASKLVDRGFISKADLEQKAATRDAAAARVKVAQAQLSETRARNGRLDIRAPAAGLVLTRAVEPGQIVGAGSGTLFRMAKGGEMEMRAQLAETDLMGLPVGAQAQVTPVGDTKAFPGQVWQVSPVIDPQTRQGIARIALKYDPALRPGGFASATIVGGAAQAPELPQSAIQSDDAGNFVYVIGAGDKIERRGVKIGTVSDNSVAIADGLNGTERVVLSAGAFLNPGQKIKPVVQKAAVAAAGAE